MLCPTNHNNTSSVMSQMWNNSDSLRYVWCNANSRLNLSKAQQWPITDQMRWEKSQRVYCSSSAVGWKWRGHTDLLWFLFTTVSVSDHREECLHSYRRRIWVFSAIHYYYNRVRVALNDFSKGSRNVKLPVKPAFDVWTFVSWLPLSISALFSYLFYRKHSFHLITCWDNSKEFQKCRTRKRNISPFFSFSFNWLSNH